MKKLLLLFSLITLSMNACGDSMQFVRYAQLTKTPTDTPAQQTLKPISCNTPKEFVKVNFAITDTRIAWPNTSHTTRSTEAHYVTKMPSDEFSIGDLLVGCDIIDRNDAAITMDIFMKYQQLTSIDYKKTFLLLDQKFKAKSERLEQERARHCHFVNEFHLNAKESDRQKMLEAIKNIYALYNALVPQYQKTYITTITLPWNVPTVIHRDYFGNEQTADETEITLTVLKPE